jgi:Haem-NO-binding
MHGRIFWELRDYAEARCGAGTWLTLLKNAGLKEKVYLTQSYPDSEMVLLVAAACKRTGKPPVLLLEEFGEFMAPNLMGMYAHLMKPEWRTLDVIEHAERTAHSAARLAEAGTAPPFLLTKRIHHGELTLTYSSPRKLCAIAVGVAKGLEKHFQEEITVHHSRCMLRGAPPCEILFQARAIEPLRSRAQHG